MVEDRSTGQSRPLYNYLQRIAVAWSGGNRIIVTDYLNKKNARILVFSPDENVDQYLIDRNHLAYMLPGAQRSYLRDNDHVFLEAVRVEGKTLFLRVWGYGAHDPHGFRLNCEYDLEWIAASCRDTASHP